MICNKNHIQRICVVLKVNGQGKSLRKHSISKAPYRKVSIFFKVKMHCFSLLNNVCHHQFDQLKSQRHFLFLLSSFMLTSFILSYSQLRGGILSRENALVASGYREICRAFSVFSSSHFLSVLSAIFLFAFSQFCLISCQLLRMSSYI